MTTIDIIACRVLMPKLISFLQSNTLCITTEYKTGVCPGDFGGALATHTNPRVLVGISSWTQSPCGFTRPDVYADVFQQLSFIRSAMR